MPLAAGVKLGPYEVLGPLGAGGMGEVSRARDTRLARDVALKAVPEHLAADQGALARFQTEARAVAALSHPNILAIFDVGEANGTHYAVTELLEGQTLRAALARGALGVRRALEVAEGIAQALAAAHENGIVHRDVKPENVFLTRDGHVKVLDFGLARREEGLLPGEDTRSPTAPVVTGPGAVVGTVAYMSPEQARGGSVDHRTDQFSLGITLYESLAGKRPFVAPSAAETLTAIIREEPEPLEKAVPGTPAPVRWVVERLLAKEPDGRYDSTRDLARDLHVLRHRLWQAFSGTRAGVLAPSTTPGSRAMRPGMVAAAVLAVGLSSCLVFLAGWWQGRNVPGAPPAVVRTSIDIRPATSLTPAKPIARVFTRVYRAAFALSPDGRHLAFAANRSGVKQVYLRRLDQDEAVPIPGSEDPGPWPLSPFFSPDGSSLGFSSRGAIWRVPLSGGPAVRVAELEGAPFGAVFADDGAVLYGPRANGPILRVPATGGPPRPVTHLDSAAGEIGHRLPSVLPGGAALLFTAVSDLFDSSGWSIVAERLGSGERRVLVQGATDGRYVPTGHLVYARRGSLLVAPFDPVRLEITGPEAGAVADVMHAIFVNQDGSNSGTAQYSFSRSGSLAYLPGGVEPPSRCAPAWIGLDGRVSRIDAFPAADAHGGHLSPDGNRVLYGTLEENLSTTRVFDLARGTLTPVPGMAGRAQTQWSPDGQRIVYMVGGRAKAEFLEIPAAGGTPRGLFEVEPADGVFMGPLTPNGKGLVYGRGGELWLRAIHATVPDTKLIVRGKTSIIHPALSPDGRLLAYACRDTGRSEVYVQSLDGQNDRTQVSAEGGEAPVWSPSGEELYFLRDDWEAKPALYSVRLETRSPLRLGVPRRLVELPAEALFLLPGRSYDLAPDGKRFLFILRQIPDPAPVTQIQLVQSWFEELKAKTATKRAD